MRVIAFLLAVASLVSGDQIVMKNGDRLSGTVTKHDGKKITLKSEFAGTVEVPWDAVTEVTTNKVVFVTLADGQTVVGTVTTEGANFRVQTKATGTVTVPRATVTGVRSEDEQKAWDTQIERLRNPRIVDLWAGFVDFGYAQSTGNAIVSTITTSANAVRATSRDKISTYFTSLYSKNNTTGTSLLVANAIRGGVGYSVDVSRKTFVFGSVDLEFDEFQRLDLRFVPAGGFGYHAIKNTNTMFDLFTGASLNREFFATGLRRSSGEILFGDELTRKMFDGVMSLRQRFVMYPNLSDRGEVRMNFDLSQATTLRRWLAWQVTFSNRYLSNPVPGRKTNDLLISTGFRFTFAR